MSRQKRLDKASLRVLFSTPFFSAGVCKLPVRFTDDPGVPTACTDGKEILWNGKWFDALPDDVLPTILCHEACHCLLGHLWRFAGKDRDLANQACDHATNLMLKEFSAMETRSGRVDPFPFPEPHDAYCADPRFVGMAEEVIYGILSGSKPPPPSGGKPNGKGGGSGNAPSPGQSSPGKPSPGKGAPTPGAKPSPHSMPEFGQFTPQKPDAPGAQQIKTDWDATMIQSCAAARGRGHLPGMLEKYLTELVSPSVDWPDALRSWLREQCSDDWDFMQPAMEYSGSEFILPSMRSEKMGPVVFASDWSGSTYGELVKKFHAEKQACLDECRPSKLIDFGFDTRVLSQREYVPGDTIDTKIKGGGGTSFVEVLKTASELQPRPKAIVLLTDCDGDWPEEAPDCPLLVVTWSKGAKIPYGDLIYAG